VSVDLAATYRLVREYGCTDMIYNHISASVPYAEGHFLLDVCGLAYDEIMESSLVTVDLTGNIIDASDPICSIFFRRSRCSTNGSHLYQRLGVPQIINFYN